MPVEYQNFAVSTSNFLGFEHQEYLDELQSLALSQPSKYYEIRKYVLRKLKIEVVESVYDTYYNLLTRGEIKGEAVLSKVDNVARNPAYPGQLASKFSLSAAKTINEILDKCLDIILPESHLDVMKLRLNQKSVGLEVDK